MDNLEKLKDNKYDVFSSLLALTMDNNKILNTILDVITDMHVDGKSDEEKKSIAEYVNSSLKSNLDRAAGLMVLVKKDPE